MLVIYLKLFFSLGHPLLSKYTVGVTRMLDYVEQFLRFPLNCGHERDGQVRVIRSDEIAPAFVFGTTIPKYVILSCFA
jgi:hypothetical protein